MNFWDRCTVIQYFVLDSIIKALIQHVKIIALFPVTGSFLPNYEEWWYGIKWKTPWFCGIKCRKINVSLSIKSQSFWIIPSLYHSLKAKIKFIVS